MPILRLKIFILFMTICIFSHMTLCSLETYEVLFTGVEDPSTLQLLRSASQLVSLDKNPPSTAAALMRRAEADIPRFTKILQSMAYYDSSIELNIQLETSPAQVIFEVQLGEQFIFSAFDIVTKDENSPVCSCIDLKALEIVLNTPAYPKTILHAEDLLLTQFSAMGYPLCTIKDREVIADVGGQTVAVTITVETGPKSRFGPLSIIGSKNVCKDYFLKKIAWREGEFFDPCKVEETVRSMEASSLFSTINIRHAESIEEEDSLPIEIDVVESKHRSLGYGVGYSTMRSFGILGEYENRNERHQGERFKLTGAIWNNLYDGTYFYLVPDWRLRNQDLIWLIQAHHEVTKGYTETFHSASVSVERQFNPYLRTTYGLMFKNLVNWRSDNNGAFNLFKLPMSLKWVDVDDPVDPSYGYTVNLKVIPSFEIFDRPFAYCINLLTLSSYLPMSECGNMIFATKMTFGTIIGSSSRVIPPSERFYAGSEETLRGYRYLTVSPLGRSKHTHKKDDPLGGRSMMIFNFEMRRRITEDWGMVLFYDIGNVYNSVYPRWNNKQLQAVGAGARYHTPVGPLRLDIAFPLDRRKHLDRALEVYLSLGQTF
ncbi:MAG: BamA/TamA family outer membrane protein [Parachlamydiales bacterium]